MKLGRIKEHEHEGRTLYFLPDLKFNAPTDISEDYYEYPVKEARSRQLEQEVIDILDS